MEWRRILWPFALVYDVVTRVRNTAFDKGWLSSQSFGIPVIAVGNLSTGGTGKTPMTEFLLNHLKRFKLAVVSRGYGRKTKGTLIANTQSTSLDIGDEPLQIYRKFPHTSVVVSERRADGISALLKRETPEAIILDDAFQHRYVKAGLYILLSTYSAPFYKDLLLPAGNLRESRAGFKRANIIVITKCPKTISRDETEDIRKKVKLKEGQLLFFSTLKYGEPISFSGEKHLPKGSSLIALTGIANPDAFIREVEQSYNLKKHMNYRDHYNFSMAEISKIEKLLQEHPELDLITTEKDMTRIEGLISPSLRNRFFYLPIQTDILFGRENEYCSIIENYIKSHSVIKGD